MALFSQKISKALWLFLFCLYFVRPIFSQCYNPVTHSSGSKIVDCINVTVTSSGAVSTATTYCPAVTSPYLIAFNQYTGIFGNGSYTFNFTPAVTSLTLNFSGISHSGLLPIEEIRLYVNGTHYAIPSAGSYNACDAMAVLTPAGNIIACNGCSLSGWKGTVINGPVSSLTVLDTMLNGNGQGSLFSLGICGSGIKNEVDLGKDTILCVGQTLALDATNSLATYQWSDNSVNPNFLVSQQGTYWVNVTNSCGTVSDTIQVNYITVPDIDLGPAELKLCNGEVMQLNAFNSNSLYSWQDHSTNSTLTVTKPGGVFWVDVKNKCGIDRDTIRITYEECEMTPLMPNIFTPNNDYANDYFHPQDIKGITSGTLSIFDRWGKKLYETDDLVSGWDGRHMGVKCTDGTYFWILNYQTIDNKQKTGKGFVTLIQ